MQTLIYLLTTSHEQLNLKDIFQNCLKFSSICLKLNMRIWPKANIHTWTSGCKHFVDIYHQQSKFNWQKLAIYFQVLEFQSMLRLRKHCCAILSKCWNVILPQGNCVKILAPKLPYTHILGCLILFTIRHSSFILEYNVKQVELRKVDTKYLCSYIRIPCLCVLNS